MDYFMFLIYLYGFVCGNYFPIQNVISAVNQLLMIMDYKQGTKLSVQSQLSLHKRYVSVPVIFYCEILQFKKFQKHLFVEIKKLNYSRNYCQSIKLQLSYLSYILLQVQNHAVPNLGQHIMKSLCNMQRDTIICFSKVIYPILQLFAFIEWKTIGQIVR